MKLIDPSALRSVNIRGGAARISVRQRNQALWIAAGFCCGVAVLVALLGVVIPTTPASTDGAESKPGSRRARSGSEASLPTLESFESIWAKSLRRPLVDSPAAQPQVASTPLPA